MIQVEGSYYRPHVNGYRFLTMKVVENFLFILELLSLNKIYMMISLYIIFHILWLQEKRDSIIIFFGTSINIVIPLNLCFFFYIDKVLTLELLLVKQNNTQAN